MEIASGAVAADADAAADADGAAALVALWKCILKKSARAFVILILWIFSSFFLPFPFHVATNMLPHATKRPRLGSKKCFLIENVPSQLRLLIVGVAGPEEGT